MLADDVNGQISDTASGEKSVEIEVDKSESISLPTLTAQGYEKDDEFGHMYRYLKYGQLSGDNNTDRQILLLCDQYVLENDATKGETIGASFVCPSTFSTRIIEVST